MAGCQCILARNLLAPGEADGRLQPPEAPAIGEPHVAGAHVPGELDRTVTDPQQAADLEADRLPQSPYLPVAPLVEHDAEAAVGAIAGRIRSDAVEPRLAILERDPRPEFLEDFRPRAAPQPDPVLPLDTARGVHQPVGELPIGREQEEPCGVHIEPPDTDPAPPAWAGQSLEDRRPPLRVAPGRDLAHGLVIKEYLVAPARLASQVELRAVEAYLIRAGGAIAELSGTVTDRLPALADPAFHGPARAEPRLRQELLQSDHAIIATKS